MRRKRPPVVERLVFGTAFVLAAVVLYFAGQRALNLRRGAAPPPSGVAAAEAPPLAVETDIRRSGARDGVLNLPPLKVAGVGGGRLRKSSEPPPPK